MILTLETNVYKLKECCGFLYRYFMQVSELRNVFFQKKCIVYNLFFPHTLSKHGLF